MILASMIPTLFELAFNVYSPLTLTKIRKDQLYNEELWTKVVSKLNLESCLATGQEQYYLQQSLQGDHQPTKKKRRTSQYSTPLNPWIRQLNQAQDEWRQCQMYMKCQEKVR